MKKPALPFFFLMALGALAFKGNNSDKGFLLKKTVSLLEPRDTSSYIYLPDGRLWKNYNGFGFNRILEYKGDSIIETVIVDVLNDTTSMVYFLNRQGIADSGSFTHKGHQECIYYRYNTGENRTTEETGCANNRQFQLSRVYEDGNKVKELNYANGVESTTSYYEYYTEMPNQVNRLSENLLGYSFRGRDSKNLLKKVVRIGSPRNDTVAEQNYHYYFDKKGRIEFEVMKDKKGNMIDSVKYFY